MTVSLAAIVDFAGLISIALWVVFRLLRLIALRENALPVAFSLVLILMVAWPSNPAFAAAVAVLAPFGVLLPALALRSIARSLGVRIKPFHWAELLGFAGLYGAFLAASGGVIPLDVYAFGYTPVGAAGVALAFCLWGLIRNSLFLPVAALISTVIWVFDLGSSNAFDNLTHVALLPLAIIALPGAILRAISQPQS